MTELPLWACTAATPRPPKHDWPASPRQHVAALGGTGILAPADIKDFNGACLLVLAFMRDGEWHTARDIIATSGQREGLRRMRELRRLFTVERRRMTDKRDFEYRLDEATNKQAST